MSHTPGLDRDYHRLARRQGRINEELEKLEALLALLRNLAWIREQGASVPGMDALIDWAGRAAHELERHGNALGSKRMRQLQGWLIERHSRIFRAGVLNHKLWATIADECKQTTADLDLSTLEWRREKLRKERRDIGITLANIRALRSA